VAAAATLARQRFTFSFANPQVELVPCRRRPIGPA
jgi:hypothetical protein